MSPTQIYQHSKIAYYKNFPQSLPTFQQISRAELELHHMGSVLADFLEKISRDSSILDFIFFELSGTVNIFG